MTRARQTSFDQVSVTGGSIFGAAGRSPAKPTPTHTPCRAHLSPVRHGVVLCARTGKSSNSGMTGQMSAAGWIEGYLSFKKRVKKLNAFTGLICPITPVFIINPPGFDTRFPGGDASVADRA